MPRDEVAVQSATPTLRRSLDIWQVMDDARIAVAREATYEISSLLDIAKKLHEDVHSLIEDAQPAASVALHVLLCRIEKLNLVLLSSLDDEGQPNEDLAKVVNQ